MTNGGAVNLTNVDVTDTFDATKLSFVSAVPAPTTVGAGTLTWDNLLALACRRHTHDVGALEDAHHHAHVHGRRGRRKHQQLCQCYQ